MGKESIWLMLMNGQEVWSLDKMSKETDSQIGGCIYFE